MVFIGKKFFRKVKFEKTVVRPVFHSDDKILLSSNSVEQFVKYLIAEKYPDIRITNFEMHKRENGVEIFLYIDIKYSFKIYLQIKNIQRILKSKIEESLGIKVKSVDIDIQEINQKDNE